MDPVWEEAWEAWGSCDGQGKAKQWGTHSRATILLPLCPQHWYRTQVTSLPVSHLVLLELSEKLAAISQCLIPNLSLCTAPQLFTLTLQPLFFGADFLSLFLLPLMLRSPHCWEFLLKCPVSLMNLTWNLKVYLGWVPWVSEATSQLSTKHIRMCQGAGYSHFPSAGILTPLREERETQSGAFYCCFRSRHIQPCTLDEHFSSYGL